MMMLEYKLLIILRSIKELQVMMKVMKNKIIYLNIRKMYVLRNLLIRLKFNGRISSRMMSLYELI